jgi:peroxiredoxin
MRCAIAHFGRCDQSGRSAAVFGAAERIWEEVRSSKVLANGPLVLTVFRGSCRPYCVAELYALEQVVVTLQELGTTIAVITRNSRKPADL